jgi:signal transduction histidine kinase
MIERARRRGARLGSALRHPQTTVRWRLTLLYGGLFLVSGVVLLAVTYTLVSNANRNSPVSVRLPVTGVPKPELKALQEQVALTNTQLDQAAADAAIHPVAALEGIVAQELYGRRLAHGERLTGPERARVALIADRLEPVLRAGAPPSPGKGRAVRDVLGGGTISIPGEVVALGGSVPARSGAGVQWQTVKNVLAARPTQIAIAIGGARQRSLDLHHLVIESSIALAIMALLAAALGWLVAGRVLRPLRTMTTTTQEISEANLDRRLAMSGPPDELRRLSDTIDELLERLERAFEAQRRFVANASHELRTPLTTSRALLEMAITDPHATTATYREICEQALEEGEHQEQLIDALLTLAQSQRGLERREPVDLTVVTATVLAAAQPSAEELGVRIEAALAEDLWLSGDPRLIERLVANLVDNAVRHNVQDGRVAVRIARERGATVLSVENTGPAIPADEVARLLQPFQRLEPDRVASRRSGLGLGLSIVAAIADAHHAALTVAAGGDGGLAVSVRFALYAATSSSRLAATPSISSLNDSENFSTPSRSSRSTTSS